MRMSSSSRFIAALILAAACGSPAAQSIYKCADGSGGHRYQQTQCASDASTKAVVPMRRDPPKTPGGRPLTPYSGEYVPLGVVVEGGPGPSISTLPRRAREPQPVSVEVGRGRTSIRPAAGQSIDIRQAAASRHAPAPAAPTVYVDALGREIRDAVPAGPNAYFDRNGAYRLTHDRGDGAQTAYPGQDRPSAREAYDRAARALDDQ